MEIQTVQHKLPEGYIVNDNWYVPVDPDNRDYAAVQRWIADGNTPADNDPAPVPDTDQESIEHRMDKDPMLRAMIKRMARLEGKMPRQVMNELKAEL